MRTTARLAGTETTITDGVKQTTVHQYDLNAGHHQPSKITTWDSQGRKIETTATYSFDTRIRGTQDLRKHHMLVPITQATTVGGDQVSGSQHGYRNISGFPRLSSVHRYDATEDSRGRWSGGWVKEVDILSYQYGMPHRVRVAGWRDQTLTWSSRGLLEKKSFMDHQTRYEYHGNTRLLKKITSVDGSYVNYTYDALGRLKTVRPYAADGSYEVQTEYDYIFAANASSVSHNHVKTITRLKPSAAARPYTGLRARISYAYLDGLGRARQTVNQQASDIQGNGRFQDQVVDHVEYDAQGRPHRNYRPYISPNRDGSFHAPPGDIGFTATTYYSDPLSRPHKVTPPDWDPSSYVYGHNRTALTGPAGTRYPVASLTTTATTDADKLTTVNYKNLNGSTVLVEQYDARGRRQSQTWNVYDEKQRLTTVFPPATSTATPNLIYQYTYDGNDNLSTKKVPDRPLERYHYNPRHLLTYTQNAGLPSNYPYLATAYDEYGRAIGSGLVRSLAANNEPALGHFPIGRRLSQTIYGPSHNRFLSTKPVTELTYLMNGQLPTSQALRTNLTYDDFGRVSSISGNSMMALSDSEAELTQSTYGPDGQLVQSTHRLQMAKDYYKTTNTSFINVAGQLVRQTHNLRHNNAQGAATIAEYRYNAAGQVQTETLGNRLQQVDFAYHKNGMLKAINNPTAPGTDLFALGLSYLDAGAAAGAEIGNKSNGNITGLTHYTPTTGRWAQNFTYDALNRLKSASARLAGQNYASSYTYDPRGNIRSLRRYGHRRGRYYGQIDHLSYRYKSGSNQIDNIYDRSGWAYAAGFNNAGRNKPYGYDAMGNTKVDPANGLQIAYNHLNLPYRFTKTNGTIIDIVYSSTGQKLREITTPKQGKPVVRTYLGDLQFVGDELAFATHAKGRVLPESLSTPNRSSADCGDTDVPSVPDYPGTGQSGSDFKSVSGYDNFLPRNRTVYEGGRTSATAKIPRTNAIALTGQRMVAMQPGFSSPAGTQMMATTQPCSQTVVWRYEYNLTDHLGNTRVRFADLDGDGEIAGAEVLGEHHYYAFGLEMVGSWNDASQSQSATDDNRYRYNGKELNEELGLYEYGFRWYDPAIGRFTGVDPISDQFPHVSTYNYAENEPIANIDLHGLQKVSVHVVGEIIRRGGQGQERTPFSFSANVDQGQNNRTNLAGSIGNYGYAAEIQAGQPLDASPVPAEMVMSEIRHKIDEAELGVLNVEAGIVREGVESAVDELRAMRGPEQSEMTNLGLAVGADALEILSALVESGEVEVGWGRDGSEGVGYNENGEPYRRKFTNIISLSIKNGVVTLHLDDNTSLQYRAAATYTQERCLENCDDE